MLQIQLRQWTNHHSIPSFVVLTYLLSWGILLPTSSVTVASLPTQTLQLETTIAPTAPTTQPSPPSATATLAPLSDQEIISKADIYLSKLAKARLFSGSVLIARNGKVLVRKGYGEADREKHVVNTAQTKFRIGSLTKQFTAMAILSLQAQGKLDVHDRICTYLSEFPATWQKITLHHLLLPRLPDYPRIAVVSPPNNRTVQRQTVGFPARRKV